MLFLGAQINQPQPFISISKQCEHAQKWLLDVAFHSLHPSGALKNKRSTAEPDCSGLDAQLRPRWDDAWWELWVNAALFRNISVTVWLKLAYGWSGVHCQVSDYQTLRLLILLNYFIVCILIVAMIWWYFAKLFGYFIVNLFLQSGFSHFFLSCSSLQMSPSPEPNLTLFLSENCL